jgi:triosephosphate isomerase
LKDKSIKIREKIEKELETLDLGELSILYEQIKLITRKKSHSRRYASHTIEEIQKMISSSKSSWTETVYIDREERLWNIF